MQADEPLRAVGDRGQAGDRNRGGVRGHDGVGPRERGQGLEDRLLDLFVLGGRLDGEIGLSDDAKIGGEGDVAQRLVHRCLVDVIFGDLAGEVLLDVLQAGLEPVRGKVVDGDVVAVQCDDMSDPCAHLARADHPD